MAKYNYSTKLVEKDNTAKVVGRELGISTKQSIEICNWLRKLDLETAKRRLTRVLEMKQAVPFRIFNDNISHKPGMGPGRYPQKSSAQFLALLKSAEANAQFKGLDVNSLVISHICAKKGSTAWHYGRKGGRHMKRTNLEIVLEEVEKVEKPKKKVREVKK